MDIQAVSSTGGSLAALKASSTSNATQEATETLAMTKQEAAKGDQQAVQKLARMQQAQVPAPTAVATQNIGNAINVAA